MTAENFQVCLAFTLKYEGGRSNDPRDPGGRTNQGVTQATYDAYRDRRGGGRRTVYAMLPEERDAIYRNEYWGAINADKMLPGEDLATFDLAVNSGPARALAIRASVLKTRGISRGDIISGICAKRLSFLKALRTWGYFGAGWGRRVAACEALALRMAYGKAAPDVLTRKAGEAKFRSGKKSTQATVGGTIAGSVVLAHALHDGHMSPLAIVILVAMAAAGAGIFFFHAWRQRQRAAALGAAVADLKAQHEMLEQKTKAAAAQAGLAGKEVAKKAQELAVAQKAISELGIKPVETKT